MKRLAYLLALFLTGCASLPPTNLPVCGNTRQFEEVCRAPVMCLVKQDTPRCDETRWTVTPCCDKTEESSRDYEWEKAHVCPASEPLEGYPNLVSCYVHAGARDSRSVYRRVVHETR